jgi:hypothetical protein
MKVPKGSHRMPDGSIMKNSAMRKRKTKKRKTRKKQRKHRIKKHGNLIPRKRARKRRRKPPPMNWGHGVIPPDTTNTNAGGGVFFSGSSLAHSFNLASSTFAGPKSIDANFNVSKMGTATVSAENADATRRLAQSARDTEIQMLHQQLSTGREALAALSRQDQATASVGGNSLNESVSSAGPTGGRTQRVRLNTQVGAEVETTPKPARGKDKHPRREEFLAKGRRAAVAKKVSDQQEDKLAAARTRIAEQKAKDADSLNP